MKIVPSEGQASQFLIMLFPWMWEEGGRRERGGGAKVGSIAPQKKHPFARPCTLPLNYYTHDLHCLTGRLWGRRRLPLPWLRQRERVPRLHYHWQYHNCQVTNYHHRIFWVNVKLVINCNLLLCIKKNWQHNCRVTNYHHAKLVLNCNLLLGKEKLITQLPGNQTIARLVCYW